MAEADTGPGRVRRRVALVAAAAIGAASLVGPGATAAPAGPAVAGRPATGAVAGRAAAPDPKLTADLDAVAAFAPPDSCISVSVDGRSVYRHRATEPLVPASTEKLFTAQVALDVIGPDTTFATRAVAASAPVGGVVEGDLTLVGGGDPVLVTTDYRLVRGIGDDQPSTSLDALADQLRAAGVTRITGSVVGDETRYDAVRTGPSWPERFVTQNQSGPLSALTVDDGYRLVTPPPDVDEPVRRERSDDPPRTAATLLAERLFVRGIVVDGLLSPGSGPAPPDAVELARVSSPPVTELVRQMLVASDNQIAELLTKEIGRLAGAGGTTEAGATTIDDRTGALGVDRTGADAVDGSGLDPANRATCDSLVSVLDRTGGLGGTLGPRLPTAGRTGTLAGRFRGSPAEGRLHAKTGSLNEVATLAGFVELPDGGTATFAFMANGRPVDATVRGAEDFLATILASYRPPCPSPGPVGLVAPMGPYAGGVGTLAMFPLQSVLLPGAVLPLHVFEQRYRSFVDRCVALEEDFGVALISRGSEVGGGDVRTDVGTRARIVQADQAPDGRWAVLAVGVGRLRIDGWLDDDPYPIAEVTDWPDPPAPSGLGEALDASAARLRRVLGLRAELGEPGPPATVDLAVDLTVDDPTLATFRLVGLSPLGDLDRQRLLATHDATDRLARLDALLDEEEQVARARLGGA